MKFPSIFKPNYSTSAAASPWPWPVCVNSPKTLSFRDNSNSNLYKTIDSTNLDDKSASEFAQTPDSFFSIRDNSLRGGGDEYESFSSAYGINEETTVTRCLKSDRLFFDPGETSSILDEATKAHAFPYRQSAKITVMDSNDPFVDFRDSMAEMVETHRLESWDCLVELLMYYLRVNEKSNHGYIIEAFVDLLVNMSLQTSNDSAIDEEHCSSSSTTTQYSFTSPLSFSSSSTHSSTSPCLSPLENEDDATAADPKEGV